MMRIKVNRRTLKNDDLTLLLLFKDPPELSTGFVLATQSSTITKHKEIVLTPGVSEISETNATKARQLILFLPTLAQIKLPSAKEVPVNCCIWGWWRKPWEHNDNLLKTLSQFCENNKRPDVLLYNQYLRKIYKAKLHDVYFIPKASSVEIPSNWISKCPKYYVKHSHRCGAFFALEIENPKEINTPYHNASEVFKDYHVDELSFSILRDDFISAVHYPNPKEIQETCQRLIDKHPSPHILKATEHTIFALRKKSRKDITKKLLLQKVADKDLADAFKRTEWAEIKEVLFELDIKKWPFLLKRPLTLKAISDATYNKIIRFDIVLVASALSNKKLLNGLIPKNGGDVNKFKQCLVEWLLEENALKKRQTAANLFNLIWVFIQNRYGLIDLEKYFEKLPIMEGIAYSTQYGIEHKFYRDHLNHNIRSALLSAYCSDQMLYEFNESWNETLVAFLAGLLHDIAHPLASYEKIGRTIEGTLQLLKLPIASRIQSLVDHTNTKQDFCIVTLLSSIKNLRKNQKHYALSPFGGRDAMIELADSRLNFEEMACAMCDDHALLSAVAIWNAAFPSDDPNKTHKIETRFVEGSNLGEESHNDKQKKAAEFLNLIQCIALHDRKGYVHSLGDPREQFGIPAPLDFLDFPIPVLTIITDDLQEWGRPIGDFAEALVTDSQISIEENLIKVDYTVNAEHSTIGSTPYSFLEHTLAKIRHLSQLKFDKDKRFSLQSTVNLSQPLVLTNSSLDNGKLEFTDSLKTIWPYLDIPAEPRSFSCGPELLFLSVPHPIDAPGKEKVAISDFILLHVDPQYNQQLNPLKASTDILSMIISNTDITIITSGFTLRGKIERYYFGSLDDTKTILKADDNSKVDFSEPVGILKINVNEIETKKSDSEMLSSNLRDLHLKPCPHFLDLDWRFSFEAAYIILQFIRQHCSSGTVCYLGCPTLAIYHQTYQNVMAPIEYKLYDKGHYALTKWCREGFIDKNKVILGNVFDSLKPEMKSTYDIVIVDPPWYEEHYRRFWERAIEIVKPKGLIGIAEYPGYDPEKLDKFERIKKNMVQAIGEKTFFSSTVISYVPPEFEKSWGGNREFTHAEFGTAYRPTYMDFYQIEEIPDLQLRRTSLRDPTENALKEILPLDDRQYIRCRKSLSEYLDKPIKVETRTNLDRIKKESDLDNVVAWSTANTWLIVDKSGRDKIKNIEDIYSLVRKHEQKAP